MNTLLKPSGAILLLAPPAHDQEAKFPAVFAVVAPRSDQTVSPEELPAMQQRTIDKAQKEFGDFKLVNASTASVGGEPARRIIYTGTKLGQSLEVMYVLTVHANKPFAFSLMSGPDEFTTQRTEAEKVVESAQWAK